MKKLVVLIFLLFPLPLFAGWEQEQVKINYLLSEINQVNGVFVRNGTEYPPDKAVAHLRMKLDNALDSWFSPSQDKWTVEMFINKIASKSSLSGKAYQIKLKNGQTTNAADWLYDKLEQQQQ